MTAEDGNRYFCSYILIIQFRNRKNICYFGGQQRELSAKITSEKSVLQRLCYTAIVRQRANKKIRRTEK